MGAAMIDATPSVTKLAVDGFDTYLEPDGIRIVFHDPRSYDRLEVLLTDGAAGGLAEEVAYVLAHRNGRTPS